MSVEAPNFINRAGEIIPHVNRRDLISVAGLTSTLVLVGIGIEGIVTGNGGHMIIAALGGPLSIVATTVAEEIYDYRQYRQTRKVLNDLQRVIGLWRK